MSTPVKPGAKPILDEATFQKLLAAAYVLQQHQERTRASEEAEQAVAPSGSNFDADYASTLAEIIETQHQILVRHLDLYDAAGVIVEQVQRLTSAAGSAIALLDRDHLVYRAISGASVTELGSAVPKGKALSTTAISQGTVFRCADVARETLTNQAAAKQAGIESFISVPIFHDDQVAGVLELVFSRINGFKEHDVRTGQMMAGLVTEALTRTADEQWKQNLAAERDSMLQALEKLKPQLDRLAKDAEMLSASTAPDFLRSGAPLTLPTKHSAVRSDSQRTESSASPSEDCCARCGHEFAPQEVYCGSCGTLRSNRPPASAQPGAGNDNWNGAKSDVVEDAETDFEPPVHPNLQPIELPEEVLALAKHEDSTPEPKVDLADELLKLLPPEPWVGEAATTSKAPEPAVSPWSSASKAHEWLNSLSDSKSRSSLMNSLRGHRGDIALAFAVFVVLIAVFWTRSAPAPVAARPVNPPVPSAAAPPQELPAPAESAAAEPQPELSFWERTMISLGLAEPPPAIPRVRPTGNPGASVWVDMRTALYYCQGAELYGKTAKGKYTTQREAQTDRFEPASGKVCE